MKGSLKIERNKGEFYNVYFTYGTGGQPFSGGWTEIEAPEVHSACALFRAYHPDKTEGILNCSSVYREDDFLKTEMQKMGNFGARCRERITVTRVINYVSHPIGWYASIGAASYGLYP